MRLNGLFFMMFFLVCSQSVTASTELLNRFFTQTKTLKATFTQRVVDEDGMTLDVTGGTFYLSRPGKFRWDYFHIGTASELAQQLLADGEAIYIYDPDLEQVTERSMDDALRQIPSLSLVSDKSTVDAQFNVIDVGLTDGISWVVLQPKGGESELQQLMIGFGDGEIKEIILNDALGNETRLELFAVQTNLELEDDLFELKVPEGTDIFR